MKQIVSALKNLKSNKVRSTLTMLGIIIGIFAVVTLLNVGKAAKQFLVSEFDSFAKPNLLNALAGFSSAGNSSRPDRSVMFTLKDVEKLKTTNTQFIDKVSPEFPSTTADVIFEKEKLEDVQLSGADADYFEVRNLKVEYGRGISLSDNKSLSSVAVIGSTTAQKLFSTPIDALGKKVRIGSKNFIVIGILANSSSIVSFFDQNNIVYIPASSHENIYHMALVYGGYSSISMTAKSNDVVDQARDEAIRILRASRKFKVGEAEDFEINTAKEALEQINKITSTFNSVLLVIGSISLLVGGIGIMNIMLVTVKERTKEIGLRKSLGAKDSVIKTQFLIESVMLTIVGGLVGVVLGVAVFYLVVYFAKLPFKLDPEPIILALLVSAVTGIGFGLYPAEKASKMSPIEALRYE